MFKFYSFKPILTISRKCYFRKCTYFSPIVESEVVFVHKYSVCVSIHEIYLLKTTYGPVHNVSLKTTSNNSF